MKEGGKRINEWVNWRKKQNNWMNEYMDGWINEWTKKTRRNTHQKIEIVMHLPLSCKNFVACWSSSKSRNLIPCFSSSFCMAFLEIWRTFWFKYSQKEPISKEMLNDNRLFYLQKCYCECYSFYFVVIVIIWHFRSFLVDA